MGNFMVLKLGNKDIKNRGSDFHKPLPPSIISEIDSFLLCLNIATLFFCFLFIYALFVYYYWFLLLLFYELLMLMILLQLLMLVYE